MLLRQCRYVRSTGQEVKVESKPKLLVAIRPKGIIRLTNVLASDFSLVFCHTLADARSLLDSDTEIKAIVCGTNFDESRMFDFVRYVKDNPPTRDLPFICVKVFGGVLHEGTYAGVEKAVKLMGASAYIDFAQWRVEIGKLEAADRLRATLHALIT